MADLPGTRYQDIESISDPPADRERAETATEMIFAEPWDKIEPMFVPQRICSSHENADEDLDAESLFDHLLFELTHSDERADA